jgi:pilus assembly protein CpaE
MAATVVVGCADQSLAYELRSQLAEAADIEVVVVADTTAELTDAVVAHDPNLVLVHDLLGPEPALQVVRDLSLRRPASVSIVVTGDSDPDSLAAAMDAGARGVLTYPLAFADVQQRVLSAIDWSRHMQALLANARGGESSGRGRARVVAVAGSKGGVGTTTIATHLAWDVRRELPDHKVLVIDLDLEKGDVTSFIEARYRTSVADLAKVYQDLSLRTVTDAVFEHESGLHLLLPPADVRDVEHVTPAATRQIIGLVRQQYDLVVVDVGSHVTPVQAAVVEIADEVVTVVTPDLVSVRALRRNLGWWESLQVRKPDAVHVLLNKSSRNDEVQPETLRRLAPAPLLATVIPDLGHRLESATNSRAPELVSDPAWWQSLRRVGQQVGVVGPRPAAAEPVAAAPAPVPVAAAPDARGRRRRGGRPDDTGSASVELLGVLPAVLLVCAVLWQLGLAGVTSVWSGYAAAAAAREASLGRTTEQIRDAATDRFPSGMRDQVTVTVLATGELRVHTRVPAVFPGVMSTPWAIDVTRQVVHEG